MEHSTTNTCTAYTAAAGKKWIKISESQLLPVEHDLVAVPSIYHKYLSGVVVPGGYAKDRIAKLAQEIARDCTGPLVACCILRGATQFFIDLTRGIHSEVRDRSAETAVPITLTYMKVTSYHNTSSTEVNISVDEEELKSYEGKDLLIVEDIIDSGKTMIALLEKLKTYRPRSIRVAALLLKPNKGWNGYIPDYLGFEIPNFFVVGYGLDYNQNFRDLEHVVALNDHGIAHFAK